MRATNEYVRRAACLALAVAAVALVRFSFPSTTLAAMPANDIDDSALADPPAPPMPANGIDISALAHPPAPPMPANGIDVSALANPPAQSSPAKNTDACAPAPADPPPQPPKNPAIPGLKHAYTLMLGLRDQSRYVGDVDATIHPDGSVGVNAAQALKLLKTMLSPSAYKATQTAFAGKKEISLSEFGAARIKARFDSGKLQVVLDFPPSMRNRQTLDISNLDHKLIGSVAKPAPYSGYMNVRSSVDYVSTGASSGIQSPLFLLNGALRLHGPVIEGEAQYQPDQPGSALTRQGTRIVLDDRAHLMRWTLGDLRVQTDGFQGVPDMVGLSVSRVYDELEPQANVRPRGNRTFTLERPSTVQTFVNGQPVRQVHLNPGVYNVSNFPFVQGANDVRLRITDNTGAVQTLNFSIFFDRSLLQPGLSEFGAYAGVTSQLVSGDLRYPDPRPVLTGFLRHGFTDYLTAGFNVQASQTREMAGLTALWGSPIGTIGVDVAGSKDKTAGSGYALNVSFDRLFQQEGISSSQTFAASFEMRSKNFAILNTLDSVGSSLSTSVPDNPYMYQAGLSYGRSFGQYTFLQLNARYARGRDKTENLGTLSGTVGYGITQNTNFNVGVQYATSGFQKGLSAMIELTHRFGRTANVRADYRSQDDTSQITYENSRGRGLGAWNVSGSLEHSKGNLSFDGSADYTADRAEVGLTHTTSYDLQGTTLSDDRTSLHAATAVAFAGHSVAIGRPIFDSFAIFKTHRTLGSAPVVVDPTPEGDLARSGRLGPALLSDLASYSVRTTTYDVPTAPIGYDIGPGSLRILPPYKSGYSVTVGSDYSMIVIGRLLDRSGAPVPLLAGKAVELAPNGRTVELFTSRQGKFGAQGLRPGKWRIEMPTQPPLSYVLDIPKSSKSLFRAGDLRPAKAGGK